MHDSKRITPSDVPDLPLDCGGAVLRRLQPDDLHAFQAYRALPELGRFQGWTPMSDDAARAFLAEMHRAPLFVAGDWVQLGVADADTGRLVGDLGVWLSDDQRRGEIGFTLAPDRQGRGIATRAVRATARLFFARSPADTLMAITDARNRASVRLLQRAGFTALEHRPALFRGEACVEEVFRLTRAECGGWEAAAAGPVGP